MTDAATWFASQSFHQHAPKHAPKPEPEKPKFVYDRWDAEARCWRTYLQWADGGVEEV